MAEVKKSEAEWREKLTPEQFDVCRKKGTERAFTGKYHNHHEDGVYRCVACGAELFRSEAKFDSGTPRRCRSVKTMLVSSIRHYCRGMKSECIVLPGLIHILLS